MTETVNQGSGGLNRREMLAGAGIGGAALLLAQGSANAQAPGGATLFTHVSVINAGQVQDDVALAVQGNRIAAIGPTDALLQRFAGAQVYDGRGKALLPGLVNCHAHLSATLERGYNEDYGFPASAEPAMRPSSLLSADEKVLMVAIGALEAIKTGTTTLVENVGGIAPSAAMLASTGLRMVFAESCSDTDNVAGAMSPKSLAASSAPVFSAKKRDEGMQRISDLFEKWNGKESGRVRVFPAAALAETSSPELLKAVRDFAEKHDTNYTIHLSQSAAEIAFMQRYHGMSPPAFLARHGFLGPRLFAAHCRYLSDADIALIGGSKTIISHQANMAANRGVIPPIPQLRAAGSPIALGTDNNTNDVFSVMRTALLTERIRRIDPFPGTLPQPEDMLRDAAAGGALATRNPDGGALAVGKKADLLVVDMLRAHLVPAGRFLSALIHNGSPADIESVMVDGRFVMRDRKVLTMDEAALVAEADKVGRRIWGQVKAAKPIPVPGWPGFNV